MTLRLRPATIDDRDRLRGWRNDPDSVRASFSAQPVSTVEHSAWLDARLDDPGCLLWIAEQEGEPIGQVRLDRHGEGAADISIALAPAARGRGLAAAVLELAVREARRALPGVEIVARVKAGNDRSLRAFRRAGFVEAARAGHEVTLRRGPCTSG